MGTTYHGGVILRVGILREGAHSKPPDILGDIQRTAKVEQHTGLAPWIRRRPRVRQSAAEGRPKPHARGCKGGRVQNSNPHSQIRGQEAIYLECKLYSQKAAKHSDHLVSAALYKS